MLKSELIDILAHRSGLPVADASLCIEAILGTITEAIAQGNRVELRGFGVFGMKERNPRRARNPLTGERVDVPAKAVPYFKPGKDLAERVDAINRAKK
jgi:integration host factor subunit beta